jgi:hypothetical protein
MRHLYESRGVSALVLSLAAVCVAVNLAGCPQITPPTDGDGDGEPNAAVIAAVTQNFATSLHATRPGKGYFYSQDRGGFETLTGIPMTELACTNCHAPTLADGTEVDGSVYEPSCADCHIDPDNPTSEVAESICLACHSRQGAERSLAANADFPFANVLGDVHRDAGMVCTDCHDGDEMHGNGTSFNSMLDAGAPRPACADCHVEGGSAPVPATTVAEHATHLSTIDCDACHVQSVISCYSCHFETETQQHFKRFYGPPPRAGFVMLVNRTDRNKVSTATFQSLTYDGNAFVTVAPYYAHTISRTGARQCGDCHGSTAAVSYKNNGYIDFALFDEGALSGPSGLIPVPPDWTDPNIFRMDYVTYGPENLEATDPPFISTNWEELDPAQEMRQMLSEFSTPLTESQMNALALPIGN